MSYTGDQVRFFRTRKQGPEIKIENVVVDNIDTIFSLGDRPFWTAGSLPVGAGMPDIVIVEFKLEIFALCHVQVPNRQLLAYLRSIPRARVDTIANRLRKPAEVLIRCLDDLVEFEIVEETRGVYCLSECWKDILPDITTIEVKVSDWRRALMQAARNRVFAHRSYVALPSRIANRIRGNGAFKMLGIGILGVNSQGSVQVVKDARRQRPRVWDYYYRIAELTAQHVSGRIHAIQHKH
ncbi:hypothetical protein KQH51_04350 [bacterium]|nr:hypothetical protein [bacterium]MCB2202151.1 hypothetical protein [bacterium]